MNCIFISPHFPPQYHHFCQQLKFAGANALGIGDAPYDELNPAVRDSLTEYYRVNRMTDYEELLRACGYFTHKYGKIDRIDSLNEYWLSTEARLRDDFNVYGLKTSDLPAVRHKSEMKKRFQEAGIPVAPGRVVESLADARKLVKQIGYPVVAKPDAGVGAHHTYRLDNDKDLVRFFERRPDVDCIMEGFVCGQIHSFDGLADKNGKPVFLTSHVFSQGIMETVNEGQHLSYYSVRRIPATLHRQGMKCLEVFDVRERFFHIEFFKTDKDEFTALEINMRPPGGFTTEMFNYACDIDIYRVWAELLVRGNNQLDFERRYFCGYASRKENLRYLHSHEEIIERYGADICQVNQIPVVFSGALGELGYIFRTEKTSRLQEIIRFIHQTGTRQEA